MKLSEPMKRELFRIARASTGRGHRGARRRGHRSTYEALWRRRLAYRATTYYGRNIESGRQVTRLTREGWKVGKVLCLWLVLLAFAVGCAEVVVTPDLTQPTLPPRVEASTFGSGSADITMDGTGAVLVEVDSDGTNVMSIFTGLFDAAARFFGGGGEPPTVNIINGPVPQAVRPVGPRPPVVPKKVDTSSTPGALTD